MIATATQSAQTHRVSEPELVEHIATYAAQNGETDLEQTCDEVLAGLTDEDVLLGIVAEDAALMEWTERRYLTREGRS